MDLLWGIMASLSINKDRILLPANGKILKGLSEKQCNDVSPISHKCGCCAVFTKKCLEIFKIGNNLLTVIALYIMCILYLRFLDYTTEQKQETLYTNKPKTPNGTMILCNNNNNNNKRNIIFYICLIQVQLDVHYILHFRDNVSCTVSESVTGHAQV
jgi:hypothetical protein